MSKIVQPGSESIYFRNNNKGCANFYFVVRSFVLVKSYFFNLAYPSQEMDTSHRALETTSVVLKRVKSNDVYYYYLCVLMSLFIGLSESRGNHGRVEQTSSTVH